MPLTYQYDAGSNTVNTHATGTITTSEMLSYLTSVLADENVRTGFIEIVDFEHVEDLVVKYSDVTPFKALWQQYLEKGCRATLIHAPSDTSFGTSRMLQTVIGLSQEDAASRFIVVRSQDELDIRLANLFT